jgi:hypothetical protein
MPQMNISRSYMNTNDDSPRHRRTPPDPPPLPHRPTAQSYQHSMSAPSPRLAYRIASESSDMASSQHRYYLPHSDTSHRSARNLFCVTGCEHWIKLYRRSWVFIRFFLSGNPPLWLKKWSGLHQNKIWCFSYQVSSAHVYQFSVLLAVDKSVSKCSKTMKNALNGTGKNVMMKVWLANFAERWQIFVALSHKQNFFCEASLSPPYLVRVHLLADVSHRTRPQYFVCVCVCVCVCVHLK